MNLPHVDLQIVLAKPLTAQITLDLNVEVFDARRRRDRLVVRPQVVHLGLLGREAHAAQRAGHGVREDLVLEPGLLVVEALAAVGALEVDLALLALVDVADVLAEDPLAGEGGAAEVTSVGEREGRDKLGLFARMSGYGNVNRFGEIVSRI